MAYLELNTQLGTDQQRIVNVTGTRRADHILNVRRHCDAAGQYKAMIEFDHRLIVLVAKPFVGACIVEVVAIPAGGDRQTGGITGT